MPPKAFIEPLLYRKPVILNRLWWHVRLSTIIGSIAVESDHAAALVLHYSLVGKPELASVVFADIMVLLIVY